jgi:hypothetical protein
MCIRWNKYSLNGNETLTPINGVSVRWVSDLLYVTRGGRDSVLYDGVLALISTYRGMTSKTRGEFSKTHGDFRI